MITNGLHLGKIAVVMKHPKNAQLLVEFLGQKYEVVQCEKADLFLHSFDLVIVDDFMLKEISIDMELIKASAVPTFLPFLLITSYKGLEILKDHPLCEKVDEFIKAPIDKSELAYRVKSLLKARKLSLESDRRYYSLAESLPVGVCIIQNDKFVYVNPILTKDITKDILMDKYFLDYIHPEDQEKALKYYHEVYQGKEGPISRKIRIVAGTEMRWVDFHAKKIAHNELPALLIIIKDVTENMEKEAYVKYLSYHDKLTGMYNRAFFTKELERLEKEKLLPSTVIMGDINNLKLVNDAFGHLEGDNLIKKAAQIMQQCCRKGDIVVRWGGDEFVLVLPHAGPEDAAKVCKRIKNLAEKSEDVQINVNIALGYATKETDEQSFEDILKEAENRMYRNKLTENASARHSVIASLNNTLKEKSFETEEHAGRMQKLAMRMGEEIKLSDDKSDELNLLATLHDIGKVGIPEEILLKPGKLDTTEWEIIKEHPAIGYRIVKSIPELAHVAEGILSHHEKWDGTGYPRGLQGEQIPIISRIISIVDAYDVMTSHRPYKTSVSAEAAMQELQRCAGSQFDPELVEQFLMLDCSSNLI